MILDYVHTQLIGKILTQIDGIGRSHYAPISPDVKLY